MISEGILKELTPSMPVIFIKVRYVCKQVTKTVLSCFENTFQGTNYRTSFKHADEVLKVIFCFYKIFIYHKYNLQKSIKTIPISFLLIKVYEFKAIRFLSDGNQEVIELLQLINAFKKVVFSITNINRRYRKRKVIKLFIKLNIFFTL